MLHLRNQQLYARENRIPARERRTVAQSPTEGFGFSIFSPLVLRSPLPSRGPFRRAISPVPRLISDHGSSFVRGVMGVPLLSGREHARKKTGKKSSPSRLSSVSRLVYFPFVRLVPSFRTSFRFAVHAITFACASAERACPCAVSEILHAIPTRRTNPRLAAFSFQPFEESRRYKVQSQTAVSRGNVTNASIAHSEQL